MNLKFIIPNGSLSQKIRSYLETGGYPIKEPDRTGFCGKIGNTTFFQFDRRMVPYFIGSGSFQAGITGYDLVLASGVEKLVKVDGLNFSRSSNQPTKWVLVCKDRFDWIRLNGRPARIACELPILAKKLLAGKNLPFKYQITKIEGSEEQCVACGLADLAIVVTETGNSIRANRLRIFPGCKELLVSMPVVIARSDLNSGQKDELLAISSSIQSVASAQDFVLVAFDFPETLDLASLELPASVSPTISPLTKSGWKAGQICIPRDKIGRVTLKLKQAGAESINVVGLQGFIG